MKFFLVRAALAAAFIASPADAAVTAASVSNHPSHVIIPHVGAVTAVRPGAGTPLHAQATPPGHTFFPHVGTPTAVRPGAAASLNTQPIPPGHTLVAGSQIKDALGHKRDLTNSEREHKSVHKHHHKHKHGKAPVRGYDLKKNQDV